MSATTATTTLADTELLRHDGPFFARLAEANREVARHWPGERGARQPVHTVYGGAHLFRADTAQKLGQIAQRSLEENAPDFIAFAKALGLAESASLPDEPRARQALIDEVRALAATDPTLGPLAVKNPPAFAAARVHDRVVDKLAREPVEDLRIDFEDGYGVRADDEEDGHASTAARELARGMQRATLPPFIGIRIKSLSEELRRRAVRTLDVFLTTLAAETGGRLPERFVVTLPKVTSPAQVATAVDLFELFEARLGFAAGAIGLELMIETTQSLIDARGNAALPQLVAAGRGRVVGAHFGTYDYTASCGITAAHQSMQHRACDFAKHMMQVALAGTGVMLSDGATTTLPVGPHKPSTSSSGPAALTAAALAENRATVHRAWRLHYENVRYGLVGGFYQGWDLHPAQLPARYAAVHAFFLESLAPARERLRTFVLRATQATLLGDAFDDAATGQGLLNYFLRGLSCGALTEAEALATGLSLDELASKSFVRILEGRRALRP
jgi:citrate lyase beta subunit